MKNTVPAGAPSHTPPEIRGADVRVDLRGDEALVAQQFLHAADVGAAVQQVRGEAVAERVGRRALVEAGFFEVLFEHPGDAAGGEPGAELVGEDRGLAACLFARRELADCEPALERAGGVGADRREPFLLAFAADADDAGREIEVAVVAGRRARSRAGRRSTAFPESRGRGRRRAYSPCGAASSLPTSSVERKCGSLRLFRGLRSALAGFALAQPSRWPNLRKLRTEASRREIDVLA